jgi:peptide/nickel transport system substrate-binding protein
MLGWIVVALIGVALFAGPASARPKRHLAVLRGTFSSFPDYMDPQLAYTQEGWTAMFDTYVPLLTYAHAEGRAGTEVVPGLAKSMPEITDGGRTYTLFLRRGLRYSDGTRVRASDFEFAVKRMFRLYSGGFPFYTSIVGASHFNRTKRGGISGIVANNRTGKIVIHLLAPRSTFTHELALMFVAPVPPSTPIQDQSADPPPATGPYVITHSKPGVGWSYRRNPAWKHNKKLLPQLPSGHVNRIAITIRRNPALQVKEIERGRFDWMENPPPPGIFSQLQKRYGGARFRIDPTLNTYYFWMNTQKAPFNDLRVRQAVNYAVDALALQRIYGGQLMPTHQILPPNMAGYNPFDLYPFDLIKARELIAEANPKDREITVWTDTESPNDEAGIYYQAVLQQLGFKAHLKTLNADNYFWVIGKTSTPDLDTGWSDWFADYAHPLDWFQPLLAGSSILRTNNGNFAQIDDPSLNAEIAKLTHEPLGVAQEGQYAALDRSFMEQAPLVPYGTRVLSTFVSKRIDSSKVVWNPLYGADLTSFRFK